jgi:hypothetical protein
VTDIATLFARNPLELTRDDITAIIEEFRKARHSFSLGNMKAGSTKPPTAKQKEINDLASKMDITI